MKSYINTPENFVSRVFTVFKTELALCWHLERWTWSEVVKRKTDKLR